MATDKPRGKPEFLKDIEANGSIAETLRKIQREENRVPEGPGSVSQKPSDPYAGFYQHAIEQLPGGLTTIRVLYVGGPRPCRWGGGNDYMACLTCGTEYDYRKEPKPSCPSWRAGQ